MSQSSNRWIVVLLCVNVVLATALVYYHLGLPPAQAQSRRGGNYVLVPAAYESDQELICIIDVAGSRMTTCHYAENRKRIEFGNVLDIAQASAELEEDSRDRR